MGGDEIIAKTYAHGWLAEDAAEAEILEAQRVFAQAGWFVEPATATTLAAVRKLRAAGRIAPGESVVLMLTGAGLKDLAVLKHHLFSIVESNLDSVRHDLEQALR
jgi:threonine synthase